MRPKKGKRGDWRFFKYLINKDKTLIVNVKLIASALHCCKSMIFACEIKIKKSETIPSINKQKTGIPHIFKEVQWFFKGISLFFASVYKFHMLL